MFKRLKPLRDLSAPRKPGGQVQDIDSILGDAHSFGSLQRGGKRRDACEKGLGTGISQLMRQFLGGIDGVRGRSNTGASVDGPAEGYIVDLYQSEKVKYQPSGETR